MHISLEKCGCGIIKQVFSEQECLSFVEDLELAMSAMPDESIKTGSGAYLGARNLLTWWDGCPRRLTRAAWATGRRCFSMVPRRSEKRLSLIHI